MIAGSISMSSVLASGLAVLCVVWIARKLSSQHTRYPPSPPADPVIGHMRAIPLTDPWTIFHKLTEKYGEIVYLHVLGKNIVLLNSARVVRELLHKRSANYSDRPAFIYWTDMLGWDSNVAFMRYGDRFRKHRKLYQQYFDPKAAMVYRSAQKQEALTMLRGIISTPDNYASHISRFAAAVIMKIAYGYQVTSANDEYVRLGNLAMKVFMDSGVPGGTLVDILPIVKHLPSSLTWCGRYARKWKPATDELHEVPFDMVRRNMAAGTAESSFVSAHLEQLALEGPEDPEQIRDLKGAAGSMFGAGSETTASTTIIAILALALHPDTQRRAHEELEQVIGTDRLPEFTDRESLPYVDSFVKEVMRWRPTVPLAVPHRTIKDDFYDGMFIPGGSTIIANTWSMCKDPDVYSNPGSFIPERYLPKPEGLEEPDPVNAGVFGFGRRICPGMHLADASVWIAIASLLATVDVTKAVGEDGAEITPDPAFTLGTSICPEPFKCKIRPRSKKAESLVMDDL